jgi:hypothetical protein
MPPPQASQRQGGEPGARDGSACGPRGCPAAVEDRTRPRLQESRQIHGFRSSARQAGAAPGVPIPCRLRARYRVSQRPRPQRGSPPARRPTQGKPGYGRVRRSLDSIRGPGRGQRTHRAGSGRESGRGTGQGREAGEAAPSPRGRRAEAANAPRPAAGSPQTPPAGGASGAPGPSSGSPREHDAIIIASQTGAPTAHRPFISGRRKPHPYRVGILSLRDLVPEQNMIS